MEGISLTLMWIMVGLLLVGFEIVTGTFVALLLGVACILTAVVSYSGLVTSVTGQVALNAVLSLMSLILFTLLNKEIPNSAKYLTYGLSGFFFSGILQCYFQDDEVLIVFMFLLGYLNIYLEKESAEV